KSLGAFILSVPGLGLRLLAPPTTIWDCDYSSHQKYLGLRLLIPPKTFMRRKPLFKTLALLYIFCLSFTQLMIPPLNIISFWRSDKPCLTRISSSFPLLRTENSLAV